MKKLVRFFLTVVSALNFVACVERFVVGAANIADKGNSGNVHYREIVVPKIFNVKEDEELLSSREKTGIHSNQLVIVLRLNGVEKILDLRLNKELIPELFLYSHQENGKHRIVESQIEEIDFCHYVGEVRDVQNSWVALSTCDGLSGVIHENFHYYEIEKYNVSGYHIISEITTSTYDNFANDMVESEQDKRITKQHFEKRTKRSLTTGLEAEMDPFQNHPNYLELAIVIDYGLFSLLGKDKDNCTTYATAVVNIVNRFYSQVNISVVLVALDIWSEYDRIKLEPNKTLTNFWDYCRNTLVQIRAYDSAQLISYTNTAFGAIGVGYTNAVCSDQSVGVNDYQSKLMLALTMAHEIGHNLGLEHDDGNASRVCTCPGNECLMISVRKGIPTHFSNCSIETIQDKNNRGKYFCLKNVPKNKPSSRLKYALCGNGVVEEGEECDCGDEITCQNPCCNATMCMFTENSKCAAGACCDLRSCKVKSTATTCRAAMTECDLPEYCDGFTSDCPSDTYKLETEKCANNKSYCFHGMCLAFSGTKVLWYNGIDYYKNEECYAVDIREINYNLDCDSMFGSLLFRINGDWVTLNTCKDVTSATMEINSKHYISFTRTFSKNYQFVACHLLMVSHDNINPNVSLCNTDQVNCTTFTKLRNQLPVCAQDCHGNGWCNNKGECHCLDVFEPPNCYSGGFGGSLTSGYSRNPYPLTIARNVMLIFFVGIVPLISMAFCFIYYKCQPLKRRKRSLRVQGYVQRFVRNVSQRFSSPKAPDTIKNTKTTTVNSSDTGVSSIDVLLKPVGFTLTALSPPPTNQVKNSTAETCVSSIDVLLKPVGYTLNTIRPDHKKPSTNETNHYANVNIHMYNKCEEEIYSVPKPVCVNPRKQNADPVYDVVRRNRPVTRYLESKYSSDRFKNKPRILPKPTCTELQNMKPASLHQSDEPSGSEVQANLQRSFGKDIKTLKPPVREKPGARFSNRNNNRTVQDLEGLSVKDIIKQMDSKKY